MESEESLTNIFHKNSDHHDLESHGNGDKTLKSEKWFGEDVKNTERVVLESAEDIIEAENLESMTKEDTEDIRLTLENKSLEELATTANLNDEVPRVDDMPERYGAK